MPDELFRLITRAQEGDQDAFGEIYGLFFKRIYRFIYYSVYSRELAQDLVQETFFKAWKALPSFVAEKGSLQAFLFTIARNLIIDYKRKKKAISLELVGDIVSLDDPEGEMMRLEAKYTIKNALSILDEFEKTMVVLRYFEDFSFTEIAKVVSKREGTIRVRMHRILGKLKKYLEEERNKYEN